MKLFSLVLGCFLLSTSMAQANTTVVSWYGKHWSGRKTANGERFNPHKFTAASKTLPMGTRVLLTRGKHHVIVRINDRGPYVRGRGLDISEHAARVLQIRNKGVARVTYKILASK